ncbi:L-lactate dehydrogenase [Cryptococcus bacillisporus CA1873]|uniref:L-lactate dehydrogenase n=1 Tax=Cryptococcus bacillisporus CA1873 TaxID=1296111 RepID=A0ABR5B4V9_CRYGA|nr:L-lactate dehydrogenase [Cryptococcus bacillisporus CA1873]|eukprot:KIR58626.1 L-lactate dehydrogenase [Cryptococcus gattii CA1873]
MSIRTTALQKAARLSRNRPVFARGLTSRIAPNTSSKTVSSKFLIGAGVALAVPTYMYLNRAHLDSQQVVETAVPDKPQALEQEKKQGGKKVSIKEVLEHKDGDRVWVVIQGHVYDMTDFLEDHPGGKDIIVENRSKDVTFIFNPRHPSDQLEADNLPPNVQHLGTLDTASASDEEKEELKLKISKDEQDETERIERKRKEIEEQGLGSVVNMRDFEKLAEDMCTSVGWAYYASAADDELTKNENNTSYRKIHFRPRVLRKVAQADASTTILGYKSSLPVMISPAAMAKLGHPLGEVNMTRGAANTGIIQCISSFASCSLEEICAARSDNQPLFFQLYVNSKRDLAAEVLKRVNRLNLNAILLTVDAAVGGKRERDLRLKGNFEPPKTGAFEKHDDTKGVSEAMFAGVDPDLCWDDIKWIRSQTKLPLLVKGVQTVEDAILAYRMGADGVVLSNHGGRQLDTTHTGIDTLLEIRKHAPYLLRPEYRGPVGLQPAALEHPENLTPPDPQGKPTDRPFEIWVDGGIWRGSDAVKALCLGANAVGAGRGFLYANAVGGQQGVEHAVNIFSAEILTTMRLLGVNKVDQLRPSMVEIKE